MGCRGGKVPHIGPYLPQLRCACPLPIMWYGGWSIEGVMVVLSYLSHSDGVSWRTSSHMWGSWYFPRFLSRDGSLTWMYIASLMVLVTTCSSLPTMLKHSSLTGCPLVWLWWCIGDWAIKCSFNLSPQMICLTPLYIPLGNYCVGIEVRELSHFSYIYSLCP